MAALVETYADANAGSGKSLSVTGYTVNDNNAGGNNAVSLVGPRPDQQGQATTT